MFHCWFLVNPLVLLENLPNGVIEIGTLEPLFANAAVGHEVAWHNETAEQHYQDYVVNAGESRNDQHSHANLLIQAQFGITIEGQMTCSDYFPPADDKNENV